MITLHVLPTVRDCGNKILRNRLPACDEVNLSRLHRSKKNHRKIIVIGQIIGSGNIDFIYVNQIDYIIDSLSRYQNWITLNRWIINLNHPFTDNYWGKPTRPTLELHSRAASSVGITSPLQRSQHRKQFLRKAENNNNNKSGGKSNNYYSRQAKVLINCQETIIRSLC